MTRSASESQPQAHPSGLLDQGTDPVLLAGSLRSVAVILQQLDEPLLRKHALSILASSKDELTFTPVRGSFLGEHC